MEMQGLHQTLLEGLLTFAVTLAVILLIAPTATRLGLVDQPDQRKRHAGQVPLIGGLAIFFGLATSLPFFHDLNQSLLVYFVTGGIMVTVGVIDDRRGLNVKLRILIEMVAASIMVFGAGLWVGNLGNLMGFGLINMPFWIGYPFTLVAVFGILNAMNMIDGIDGAAGGISLIAIVVLLLYTDHSSELSALGPFLCAATAAYLVCNLKLFPFIPKIFLGDAGSKLLGLSLVWLAIDVAETGSAQQGGIEPVTALYFVGLPLFDMVTTTVRRLKKGGSPFSADRTHIHHIFQRAGFSKRSTLFIILFMAAILNLIGVTLSLLNAPEVVQFGLFFLLYFLYAYNIHHAFKLSRRLKKFLALKDRAKAET